MKEGNDMPICVYCGTTKDITGSYRMPVCKKDFKKEFGGNWGKFRKFVQEKVY